MDTSSYDVTQIWIGEEATNQTGEFLQSTHGSNGFTSEVPFGLVDTGATDAVGFDVLPYPLVGVDFRRVSRELEQAQPSMGRSHEVFDCFGSVDRMTVDNEKYRATGVVHQSLAEVDESGGLEHTCVGGETQSSLSAQCRDEVDRIAGTSSAYALSLARLAPRWCRHGSQCAPPPHHRSRWSPPRWQPQCGWPDTLRSSIAPLLRDSVGRLATADAAVIAPTFAAAGPRSQLTA